MGLHSAASGYTLRKALPVTGSYVLTGKVTVLNEHSHGKLQDIEVTMAKTAASER